MHIRTSTRVRLAGLLAVGLGIFVIYAQSNLDEVVEFARWVATDVVEPHMGIGKALFDG